MVSVSVPSMSNMTKCMACNLTRKRMEPAGSGATWTGSPKGVFAGRKHHKPRQGVVANTLKLFCNGAVGFIDLLDACGFHGEMRFPEITVGAECPNVLIRCGPTLLPCTHMIDME